MTLFAINMLLDKESTYMYTVCGFFCVFFFAGLADRIWKILGRKTNYLINMA